MDKIKSSLQMIVTDIKEFYIESKHHFLGLSGVVLEADIIEIQWIFCEYGVKNSEKVFYIEISKENTIPSIVEFIPSAIISQREIVDMFGLEVEDTTKGLYLDEDSLEAPLGGCKI